MRAGDVAVRGAKLLKAGPTMSTSSMSMSRPIDPRTHAGPEEATVVDENRRSRVEPPSSLASSSWLQWGSDPPCGSFLPRLADIGIDDDDGGGNPMLSPTSSGGGGGGGPSLAHALPCNGGGYPMAPIAPLAVGTGATPASTPRGAASLGSPTGVAAMASVDEDAEEGPSTSDSHFVDPRFEMSDP
jgi:hypothetical protein